MKHKQTMRWLNIIATGLLLAGYSAYNVFIIFRDAETLPSEGVLISAVVAVMFAVSSAFVLSAGLKPDYIKTLRVRSTLFIIALLTIAVLKLRLTPRTITYIDSSEPETVLYGISFFMTLAALLIMFGYYTFIRRRLPLFPREALILPVACIALLFGSLALEAVLLFAYGMIIEANYLRTVVMRPVFYLGLIGLCFYFLFPPQASE